MKNPNPTHVYAIRDETGVIWKIGESAQSVTPAGASIRAEQQVRDLNRLYLNRVFESEVRAWLPGKASRRAYEASLIERCRSLFWQDKLPGNLENR
ncbi:hypothetical protein [Achromobacter pestifer]